MNKKIIIFDLDGTLIDSLKDIALCTNAVLEELGYKTYKIGEYKQFIGNGAKELVKNAMPKNMSELQIQKALDMFKEKYSSKIHKNTQPFDGIYNMLDFLEKDGFTFGLLSNKPHRFTLQYMDNFFKNYNFEQIHGQKDEFPRKPDPSSAINMINSFGVEAKSVFYVGDTETDMKTALGTNMIGVGVLWGYQDKETLLKAGAKHIVQTPIDLLQLILNHQNINQ